MTEFSISRMIERFVKFSWKPGSATLLFVVGIITCVPLIKSIISAPGIGDINRLVVMAFMSSFSLGFAIAYGVNSALHFKEKISRAGILYIVEIFCDIRNLGKEKDLFDLVRIGLFSVCMISAAIWFFETDFWMMTDTGNFVETGFFQHIYPIALAFFFFIQGCGIMIWHYKANRESYHDARPYL